MSFVPGVGFVLLKTYSCEICSSALSLDRFYLAGHMRLWSSHFVLFYHFPCAAPSAVPRSSTPEAHFAWPVFLFWFPKSLLPPVILDFQICPSTLEKLW